MPLDHIAMYVQADRLDELVTWLAAAGEPLGFKEMFRPPGMSNLVAMGEDKPWFWVYGDDKLNEVNNTWRHPHMGFVAKDAEQVGKWYEAAIKAGGTENGKPGPRPMFGPNYYAAFVKDPVLGINFEAVCKTWSPPKDDAGDTKANGASEDKGAATEETTKDSEETKPAEEVTDAKVPEVDAEQPAKKRARRAT